MTSPDMPTVKAEEALKAFDDMIAGRAKAPYDPAPIVRAFLSQQSAVPQQEGKVIHEYWAVVSPRGEEMDRYANRRDAELELYGYLHGCHIAHRRVIELPAPLPLPEPEDGRK